MAEFQKPPPLDIKCTSTDCDNDLHCFKQLKKMTPDQRGKCRVCGADLVDWKRLHGRDKNDAAHTFAALQHELIRHHFFHRPVDDKALRHARRKAASHSGKPHATDLARISPSPSRPAMVARHRSTAM